MIHNFLFLYFRRVWSIGCWVLKVILVPGVMSMLGIWLVKLLKSIQEEWYCIYLNIIILYNILSICVYVLSLAPFFLRFYVICFWWRKDGIQICSIISTVVYSCTYNFIVVNYQDGYFVSAFLLFCTDTTLLSEGIYVFSRHISYIYSNCVSIQNEEANVDDLIELVEQIIAFHMKVWFIWFFILNIIYYFNYLSSCWRLL